MYIVTARVRSTREGTVFTGVCLLTSRGGGYLPSGQVGGGYLLSGLDRGGYLLSSGWGGVPTQLWTEGGGTYSALDGGGYLLSSGRGGTYLGQGGGGYLPWLGGVPT